MLYGGSSFSVGSIDSITFGGLVILIVTFLSLLGFYFGENKEIINTFVSTFKKSVIAIGVLLVIIILIKKFLIIKKNTIVTEK